MKYKPSERLFCVICGKEITGAGNRLKKFCSYECQYEHIKNTRIKYRICRTCGKEFKVSNHYRFVCSDECRKIINKININNHETIEERRTRHRKHARELRQTETGYLKETYRRMMNRLKGGITFDEMCHFYNSTNICFYCGKEIKPFTVDKQIDHKIPISKGGNNNIKNLVICCKSCNSGKCDMTDTEYINYRSKKIENS